MCISIVYAKVNINKKDKFVITEWLHYFTKTAVTLTKINE